MKTGTVFRDQHLRWYEPQHALIGGESYFTHAWGSIYVLSGHAAKTLALVSSAVPNGLRFFNNEGKPSHQNAHLPRSLLKQTVGKVLSPSLDVEVLSQPRMAIFRRKALQGMSHMLIGFLVSDSLHCCDLDSVERCFVIYLHT